ncbi:MAG: hypothetical protein KatS3mg131_1364 [Candidatus Tectimicrobiota bacterium]|nr:MAG: hypothetical protein KatS3mg131_1364 [Candidatus Tectomicrobia bacterium]
MAKAVRVFLKDGTVRTYENCEGHEDPQQRLLRIFNPQAQHLNPLAVYDLEELKAWEEVEI